MQNDFKDALAEFFYIVTDLTLYIHCAISELTLQRYIQLHSSSEYHSISGKLKSSVLHTMSSGRFHDSGYRSYSSRLPSLSLS